MLNQNQNPVNPSNVHLVNYRAIITDTNISLAMIDDCIKDFDGAPIVADKSAPALENDADAFEAFAVELDKISRARKDSVYRYRQTVRKLGYYMTARGLITTDNAQTVIKSMDAQLERGDETTARLEVKRDAQEYAELLRSRAQDIRRDVENVDKPTQPETTQPETAPGAVGHIGFNRIRFDKDNPYKDVRPLYTVFDTTPRGAVTVTIYPITEYDIQQISSYRDQIAALLTKRSKISAWAVDTVRGLYTHLFNNNIYLYLRNCETKFGRYLAHGIDNGANICPDSKPEATRSILRQLVNLIDDGLSDDSGARYVFGRSWVQPANDQPANDQPANDQPANDQPANDQPANDQPAKKIDIVKTDKAILHALAILNAAPVVETVAETVEEVETIDDDDETGDDDAEETTEEKERALELVATSTVERLGAGVVAWRHLKSDMKTAPRSWDRLRPYSLNNTLIIESTPETSGARLLITLDRADAKEDGESVIDWAQYDNAGADVWQPKKFKFIPIKDDAGNIVKDDDGKILATRKVSKYGKVTIHDADLFPWLAKKRAAKYAQLEKVAASEIKERDAKRAALLGAAPEKWADNLRQIVKRFFDGTKLTTERAALGQEIACAFIASRLGFDLQWNGDAEKKDAARLLALCTQGDKKHETTGHALQVVLKHVNKCVASILYQSQPTAIKPREEKPAPVPTVEEKQPAASVKNDDEESIVSALESFEEEATQAKNTFGLVHQDNARRAENDALLAIEEARKNKSVPDDALKIYSDRVERIHVDTAIALKEEAARRYGADWIDRHVTFC